MEETGADAGSTGTSGSSCTCMPHPQLQQSRATHEYALLGQSHVLIRSSSTGVPTPANCPHPNDDAERKSANRLSPFLHEKIPRRGKEHVWKTLRVDTNQESGAQLHETGNMRDRLEVCMHVVT